MLGVIIFMLVTIIPVKIGAEMFNADNKHVKYCILAVVIGTILGLISFKFIGGFLGFVSTYILMSVVYSRIFLFSFKGGLGFTSIVFIIQVGIAQALIDLGFFVVKLS